MVRSAVLLVLCVALYSTILAQESPPEPVIQNPASIPREDAERDLNTRIEKLIKQLGDDRFETRESATKELREIGPVARAALEKATENSDAEIASRAKGIIAGFPKVTHKILDGLGEPIALATVMVTMTKNKAPDGKIPVGVDPIKTSKSMSDSLGGAAIPELVESEYTAVALISHPDYGAARCEVPRNGQVIRLPLVRSGTEARQRALTGQVVTADGKSVAGAEWRCDHVRTPGEGLLSAVSPQGNVLTDSEGRFTCYLPSFEGDREQGKLIPPNSRYSLNIFVPGNDSYFPVAGLFANTEPVRIELPRATRQHRMRFAEVGGGTIKDPGKLLYVRVQHVSVRNGQRFLIPLDTASLVRGRKLIPGSYQAESFVGGKQVQYLPLVVTADSPEELLFQLPAPVTFRGRVVHGVSGEPLTMAFVMGWNSTSRNNLALLSADDWKALREVASPAGLDAPAVKKLGELYGVQALVRTDNQGRFEITRAPDQSFYGLLAFDEHYVPYKMVVGQIKPDEKNVIDMGEMPLFPAAKILVRPVFDGANLSTSPKWLPTEEGQPKWFGKFVAAGKNWEREFEYVHWLKLNELQPIYVPAGVRLRLRFDSSYDDHWAPAVVDTPLQLAAEAQHELGDIRFQAAFPVVVRVVDKAGAPLEGIPLRQRYTQMNAWGVAHNTDKEGKATFHVNPKAAGEFRVVDLPGSKEAREADNLGTPFEASESPPTGEFQVSLTDEQFMLLRGKGK